MSELSNFHVISVISNPVGYKSRYELYKTFEDDLIKKGGCLWTVEMQTGERPCKVTRNDKINHIQLWGSALNGELWYKENLINIGLQHLTRECPNWRYVAWIDADLKFEEGFLEKTVNALQIWDIVQMWSHAIDFGPDGETIGVPHKSFMYCYWNKIPIKGSHGYNMGGHPGFAWAARRDSLNKLGTLSGPLFDYAILGSGDRHMAWALVGLVDNSKYPNMHPQYDKALDIFQRRAELNIKRNVGYIQGTIRHLWHGRKSDRAYNSRWKILVEHQFNPQTDIVKDVSGLWQLVTETPRQISLRDEIRRYFRARKEDATTL